jgi:hypothetical protein
MGIRPLLQMLQHRDGHQQARSRDQQRGCAATRKTPEGAPHRDRWLVRSDAERRVGRDKYDLTEGEAADLLALSLPYLTRLLDVGIIPSRLLDGQRIVRRYDRHSYRNFDWTAPAG